MFITLVLKFKSLPIDIIFPDDEFNSAAVLHDKRYRFRSIRMIFWFKGITVLTEDSQFLKFICKHVLKGLSHYRRSTITYFFATSNKVAKPMSSPTNQEISNQLKSNMPIDLKVIKGRTYVNLKDNKHKDFVHKNHVQKVDVKIYVQFKERLDIKQFDCFNYNNYSPDIYKFAEEAKAVKFGLDLLDLSDKRFVMNPSSDKFISGASLSEIINDFSKYW